MDTCTACGHPVGVGRFCLNCGTPIDGEVHPDPTPSAVPHHDHEEHHNDDDGHRPRAPWWPMLAAGLALVMVAGVGLWLIGLNDADPDDANASATDPSSITTEPSPVEPSASQGADDDLEAPQDLIRFAVPTVPGTASPSTDTTRSLVRYDAENMLDGIPDTTWRTPGDASGRAVTLTFPEPAVLTRIGLINGYAKRAGSLDWYSGNRRIESVTWTFDDGTTVDQEFVEDRTMQSIDIDPVTTTSVTITIDAVTAPGAGRASRDYTAISDVLLFGTAA